jgi:hypothetical protein
VSLVGDARLERDARALWNLCRHGLADALVLRQLAPVGLELRRGEFGRVGAEEELEQRRGTQLGYGVGGPRPPFGEGLASGSGYGVGLSAATAALTLLGRISL